MATAEILAPFTLDVSGAIAVTDDPAIQAAQHVKSLVCTEPGERVMQPDYGLPLKSYLFDAGLSAVTNQIFNDAVRAFAFWEPSLTVDGITPQPSDDFSGVASVEVDYSFGVNSTPQSPTYTATVLIGGSVVESQS